METKKLFKTIMVFSIICMLFSGCGNNAEDLSNNDNPTDTNIDVSYNSNTVTDNSNTNTQAEIEETQTIENTIEDEFISEDDDVELGDLI